MVNRLIADRKKDVKYKVILVRETGPAELYNKVISQKGKFGTKNATQLGAMAQYDPDFWPLIQGFSNRNSLTLTVAPLNASSLSLFAGASLTFISSLKSLIFAIARRANA
jgi:hypothetical protein